MFLNEQVTKHLKRTPLRLWQHYALLLDGDTTEQARIMTRGELAAWCSGNDLPTLAQEARARRVPEGSLLALFLSDAGASFRVLG